MDAVINASPLILLSKIDRLYLLNEIFDKIYIPAAVLREITEIKNLQNFGMRISDALIEKIIKEN